MRKNVPALTLPEEPPELGELTCDAIAGDLRITQRRAGHRYSIDDVVTAWIAAEARPLARRCLDLGSGIGSVALMLSYRMPEAELVCIEAQRNSFRLLTHNLTQNGLIPRARAVHGDLRREVTAALGGFDLITGTPPYVPPGKATPSHDAQRAYARQELRGGIEDYIAAAAHVLAQDGALVVCGDARFPERVEQGGLRAGLFIVERCDVFPRAARPALFSVFTLERSAAGSSPTPRAFTARNQDGTRTEAYLRLREYFGIPRPSGEAPSP
jgi:tRNA1Val (adenine37-N6)-methyltransferase